MSKFFKTSSSSAGSSVTKTIELDSYSAEDQDIIRLCVIICKRLKEKSPKAQVCEAIEQLVIFIVQITADEHEEPEDTVSSVLKEMKQDKDPDDYESQLV